MKKIIPILVALLPIFLLMISGYLLIFLVHSYGFFFLLVLLKVIHFKYETYNLIAYVVIVLVQLTLYWKIGTSFSQIALAIWELLKSENSPRGKLIKQYFTFLKQYIGSEEPRYILRSHMFFFHYAFWNDFTIPHHLIGIFKSPFEYRAQVESFNDLCMKHIGKENYIKNVEKTHTYFNCYLHKGSLDGKTLVEKIEAKRDEIVKFFTTKTFDANMRVEHRNYTDILISIYNEQSLWENKTMSLKDFNVPKGVILGGFFPEIDKGVNHKNYLIKISELVHAYVTGATRSGKNIFMDNVILSCLYNIKKYANLELHFFDTKGNDTTYLDHLQSNGVYRYTDIKKYPDIFSGFVDEMRKDQALIGEYSNIYNYNTHHPDKPLKEKIIIVNEFLSLTKQFAGKELQDFLGSIVSMTSESAGAGYKCIFMSQTARKDSSPMLSEILLNIKTRFILKANNREEVEINARGLPDAERARITHMRQYNCFHVEDGVIQQEFKAYYFTQQMLKEWIDANFQKGTLFKNANINEYLHHARKQDVISYREATEKFGLTRSDWDKLIQFLEERKEIDRMPNNSIVWHKKNGGNTTSLSS